MTPARHPALFAAVLAAVLLAMTLFAAALARARRGRPYANPTPAEIRDLLSAAAVAHDIPPKVLYAIAWQESTWRQFDANGDPLMSRDGGIGIMQVTTIPVGVDAGLLQTDIAYNIDVGASILDTKWTYAPSVFPVIGDGQRHCYEDWFFAVWAYNGWVRATRTPTRSGVTWPTAAAFGRASR